MKPSTAARSKARGFTLVEALIALLVLAFGMLAVAGFQTTLSRNSDLAKQRTEAMRLAQQKMESLRAYAQVATSSSTPHVTNYTDDVISSSSTTQETHAASSTYSTNATYLTTWTATSNAANTEKWLNVNVAWTDRTGQSQSVQLLSVISKFDPADIGTLATGPGGISVRKPKNRSINVPYPAVTLSGGTQSAFQPPPSTGFYVFDNVTGNVVKSCTGGTMPTSDGATLDSTGATCSDIFAYLLSGYVRFDTSANPTRNTIDNTTDTTLPLAATNAASSPATTPISFDFSNFSPSNPGDPTYTCFSQRQKTLRHNSTGVETTVAETASESGYLVTARFVAYACIVAPVDHDSNSTTAKRWWGEVTLVPNSDSANGTTWSIGTTSSTWKICRFSADYNVDNAIANSEHPLWYRGVTGALDSQNFVVITGNNSCPTDVAANPLGSPATYVNNSTASHQPTGERSFQCANSSCSGANKTTLEPSTLSTDLTME
ncbi:type IV pilus modification protein PilV [Piscinibacter sp.]|jgi:type IV pilus modification protein PilV|uniref:type IV pilus modification protein PilV n=1 Tax=Piscinibacter sp. TaxID=1903157 RepID=UPI002F3F5F10